MSKRGETTAFVNDGKRVGQAAGCGLWRTLARAWWDCKKKGIKHQTASVGLAAAKYWDAVRPGLPGVMSISTVLSLLAFGFWSLLGFPTAVQIEVDPSWSAVQLAGCVILKTSAFAIAFGVAILLYGYFIYIPFFYERSRRRDSVMMEVWSALRGYRDDRGE